LREPIGGMKSVLSNTMCSSSGSRENPSPGTTTPAAPSRIVSFRPSFRRTEPRAGRCRSRRPLSRATSAYAQSGGVHTGEVVLRSTRWRPRGVRNDQERPANASVRPDATAAGAVRTVSWPESTTTSRSKMETTTCSPWARAAERRADAHASESV
jgi:hypothetical protein